MRRLIVVGVACGLVVGVAACGGSSSQAPKLQHTSLPEVAVFAHVESQSAGDTACETQQDQLGQQVKQIQAKLPPGSAIAGQSGNSILIALEYGSPAFPAQFLPGALDSFALTNRTSIYVNQPDAGTQSNHASVVICAVKVR